MIAMIEPCQFRLFILALAVIAFIGLLAICRAGRKDVIPKGCHNCDFLGCVYRNIVCDKCKDKSHWKKKVETK